MKPNTTVTTADIVAVNWVFETDAKGTLTTSNVAASALLELVKLVRAQMEVLVRVESALRLLDAVSLEETRDAVRTMLAEEFGLRAGR